MALIKSLFVWMVFLTPLGFVPCVLAQTNQDQIPLKLVLEDLEKKHETHFSFNPKFVGALDITSTESLRLKENISLEEKLEVLKEYLPLTTKNDGGGGYILAPRRMNVSFAVFDSASMESLSIVFITINGRRGGYLLPQEGHFDIEDVSPTDTVSISSSYYVTQKTAVFQLARQEGGIILSPDAIYLDEVSITAFMTTGINYRLNGHGLQVDMAELNTLAGDTDGDILNVLNNMPGIRSPDGKPGSLSIRGGTFDQNLIYFDGIPIYHQGHYFGTFSPYNPGIVSKINVEKGALPAKWGGRVGGLIDIKTVEDLVDSATYGIAVNSVYASFSTKIPLVEDRLTFVFSARSNYPIEYQAPKLDAYSVLNLQGSKTDLSKVGGMAILEKFDVRFQDLNSKLIFRASKKHRLSMSFMAINNSFAFDLNSPDRGSFEKQRANMDNWGLSAAWHGEISPTLRVEANIIQSALQIDEANVETENGTVTRADGDINKINDTRITMSATVDVREIGQWTFGYDLSRQEAQFVQLDDDDDGGTPNMDDQAFVHSLHSNFQFGSKEKWIGNVGVRTDHYGPLGKIYIEPRLSLTYQLNKRMYLKASAGRSHQYLKQEFREDFNDFRISNQFWFLATKERAVMEGDQVMIGVTMDRSEWLLDIELYHKKVTGIAQFFNPDVRDVAVLQTIGLDVFLKKRWKSAESWVSYTLGRTTSGLDNDQAVFYDQTHVLSLVHLWNVKRWKFATSWNLISGTPVVLPDDDEIDPGSTLNIPYADRFPFQHQLDLSVTYSFPEHTEGWRGVVGFSVVNIYDQENIVNIFQTQTDASQPFRRAVGIAPNIQFKLTF